MTACPHTCSCTSDMECPHDCPCAEPTALPHAEACDDAGCYCPDDVFWGRLLGDDDPCAPGKDWVSAAFGDFDEADQ